VHWRSLWCQALDLVSVRLCLRCGGGCEVAADPGGQPSPALCAACLTSLELLEGGLQGDEPLLWCAAASYGGPFRALLLHQRAQPSSAWMAALAFCLQRCCAAVLPGALLVPIPSWKRRGNPLPRLLAAGLVQASQGAATLAPQLLWRSRPCVGQHHLGRHLRARNLEGAFAALPPAASAGRPVWLVDDILTTGSTALAAAEALQSSGHAVQGLLALARTRLGAARCDLRSACRHGDGPG
jgi:predicted amidophosphoribosyltransferase